MLIDLGKVLVLDASVGDGDWGWVRVVVQKDH